MLGLFVLHLCVLKCAALLLFVNEARLCTYFWNDFLTTIRTFIIVWRNMHSGYKKKEKQNAISKGLLRSSVTPKCRLTCKVISMSLDAMYGELHIPHILCQQLASRYEIVKTTSQHWMEKYRSFPGCFFASEVQQYPTAFKQNKQIDMRIYSPPSKNYCLPVAFPHHLLTYSQQKSTAAFPIHLRAPHVMHQREILGNWWVSV